MDADQNLDTLQGSLEELPTDSMVDQDSSSCLDQDLPTSSCVDQDPDSDAHSISPDPDSGSDSLGIDITSTDAGPISEDVPIPSKDTISSVNHKGTKVKTSSSKTKKREDQGIEHVLRALSSLASTEEKLAALCQKYTELLEQHRLLQSSCKQQQRRLTLLSREKDQLQTDHSKAVLARSKLESLCRELQRHNKLVKEESVARAREEEEKRKEVTNKFQTTINEIQTQMNDHYTKNAKLRDENLELSNKLNCLLEQYEMREQQLEKVLKHREVEQKLSDAKLAQASLQMTEEKERSLQEKQQLLEETSSSQKKCQQLQQQVLMYSEKYEEFQGTLSKSNEVFASFKSEMDKMTKRYKKQEKETAMWRTRWENSNKALINMAEEKTRSDKEISGLNSKVRRLESLCRALQSERNKLATGSHTETSSSIDPISSEEDASKSQSSPTKTPPNTPDLTADELKPVSQEDLTDALTKQCTVSQSEPSSQSDPSSPTHDQSENLEESSENVTEDSCN